MTRYREGLAGSRKIGTVADFATSIGESDLFGVFPRVPQALRDSQAFKSLLETDVWLKVFRKGAVRAGEAYSDRIHLNSKMFTLGTPADVRATFLHEAAHVFADQYYNIRCHHDWRWVRIARLLGDTGDRCHDYSYLVEQKAKRNLVYACTSCGQEYHRVKRIDTTRQFCGVRFCRGGLKIQVISKAEADDLLRELKAAEEQHHA